jgi:hypothetical protein
MAAFRHVCIGLLVVASCGESAPDETEEPEPPQMWSRNVRVNDDATPEQQREVSVAAGTSDHWLAGWMDLREGVSELNYCAFSVSTDGGMTWGTNELYKGPYNVCGDPVVAADRAGNMYRMVIAAHFELVPRVAPIFSEIHLSRSQDGGVSWDAWRTAVAANPPGPVSPEGLNDKPWMAVDGTRVAVAWTILPDRFLFGDVMFTLTDDGGVTWTPAQRIGEGIGTCVALDDTDRIHVAWANDADGDANGIIQYRSSSDAGTTWTPVVNVADSGLSGPPDDTSLIIACATSRSGEDVYLMWTGNTTSASLDVWAAHSADRGVSWSAPVRVNDDGMDVRQTRGWVGVDDAGTVHVAWMDWRSGAARAYASRSTDRGASWSPNELVSDGGGSDSAQDYNGLAISPSGDVGFGWTDDRSAVTGMDVYFSVRPGRL